MLPCSLKTQQALMHFLFKGEKIAIEETTPHGVPIIHHRSLSEQVCAAAPC